MKRHTVTDFDGGINDIDDAQQIADNSCTEIENYEYRDLNGLKKRYSADLYELNDAGVDNIKNFAVWYSGRTLTGNSGDKIFILHISE